MQKTLAQTATLKGIGLHSGADVTLTLEPAPVYHGLVFVRSDVTDGRNAVVPVRWDLVTDTRLCTMIENEDGVSVRTIEHLMAALAAAGVDNAVLTLDGPEVPIMDGSSIDFLAAIDEAGTKRQSSPRRGIKILKEVTVTDGDKKVTLSPSVIPTFSGDIDFNHPAIGKQSYAMHMVNGHFRHELANARTFGFLDEIAQLRQVGLAQGGSLDNAIVLDREAVLNPEGLRMSDEFIRHKLLDAIGDLYLAGGPILGRYHGIKAGHALNNQILHALFADDSAWCFVDLAIDIEDKSGISSDRADHKRLAYA